MRRRNRTLIRRTIGIAWHVPFPASQPLPYSLADARNDARAMLHDIAKGIDPKVKREAQEAAEEAEMSSAQRKACRGGDPQGANPGSIGKKPIASITRRELSIC